MAADFHPAPGLRNGHLQSILASSGVRRLLARRPAQALLTAARRDVLETPAGVRLEAWISEAPHPRGVALLFHGWLGHAAASYMIETGSRLLGAGFTVVRLNFRDHGETHALNEELFHSCRLQEVVDATELVGVRHAPLPLLLAGFSLGGNFALRVALAARTPLAATVAVSPVVDPSLALAAIEAAPPMYQGYFMRRWRRSLRAKHRCFPHRFADAAALRLGLRDTTAWLVERYTEFPSLEAYLDGYAIGGDRLARLAVPTTIVSAHDDPVIPVRDFHGLELPANVACRLTPRGGHCGFIENWRLESWAARYITGRFLDATGGAGEVAWDEGEPLSC